MAHEPHRVAGRPHPAGRLSASTLGDDDRSTLVRTSLAREDPNRLEETSSGHGCSAPAGVSTLARERASEVDRGVLFPTKW